MPTVAEARHAVPMTEHEFQHMRANDYFASDFAKAPSGLSAEATRANAFDLHFMAFLTRAGFRSGEAKLVSADLISRIERGETPAVWTGVPGHIDPQFRGRCLAGDVADLLSTDDILMMHAEPTNLRMHPVVIVPVAYIVDRVDALFAGRA